jgi:hypothetical protein
MQQLTYYYYMNVSIIKLIQASPTFHRASTLFILQLLCHLKQIVDNKY